MMNWKYVPPSIILIQFFQVVPGAMTRPRFLNITSGIPHSSATIVWDPVSFPGTTNGEVFYRLEDSLSGVLPNWTIVVDHYAELSYRAENLITGKTYWFRTTAEVYPPSFLTNSSLLRFSKLELCICNNFYQEWTGLWHAISIFRSSCWSGTIRTDLYFCNNGKRPPTSHDCYLDCLFILWWYLFSRFLAPPPPSTLIRRKFEQIMWLGCYFPTHILLCFHYSYRNSGGLLCRGILLWKCWHFHYVQQSRASNNCSYSSAKWRNIQYLCVRY